MKILDFFWLMFRIPVTSPLDQNIVVERSYQNPNLSSFNVHFHNVAHNNYAEFVSRNDRATASQKGTRDTIAILRKPNDPICITNMMFLKRMISL
jgi:hypothetical protein